MRIFDQHRDDALRSWTALLTTLAFVFAPLSALAEQNGEAASQEQQEKQDEGAQKSQPAGPTPELFVLPTLTVSEGISSIIPQRIGEMTRQQLKSQREVELLASYEKLQAQSGGRANAAVAEAERLYTSGIGLLTAGEDKRAAETFQKAVDMMEKNVGDLSNFDVLADAYKNLALAYHNAGFDFDARKKMKVYAHLRPKAELDPERFPKDLREIFEKEAGKVKKGGPGELEVVSKGGEGLVFIDGEQKGKTPATIEDVGYGYHYLVVRSGSGDVHAEKIRVRGRGKSQTFEVELGDAAVAAKKDADKQDAKPAFYTGLVDTIGSGSFGSGLQPYLEELTTRTGADYIAWIAMVKEDSSYSAIPFVYRGADGAMVQGEGVEFAIDLSNLRVGVSQLSNRVVKLVETMPQDKAFTSVNLGAPAEAQPVAEASEAGESTQQQPAVAEASGATEPQEGEAESIEPPPEVMVSDKEDESNTWMWVGLGSAAVVVTGLVAGGIVLLGDDGGETPGSFDAELTW